MNFNLPTPQEIKQMAQRYAPPKPKPVKWQVWSCNKVVFENESAGLCDWWIKNSGIKAVKKPVYEQPKNGN